jgi:hypothetical protein
MFPGLEDVAKDLLNRTPEELEIIFEDFDNVHGG